MARNGPPGRGKTKSDSTDTMASPAPIRVTWRRPKRSRSRPASGRARREPIRRTPATRPICDEVLPTCCRYTGSSRKKAPAVLNRKVAALIARSAWRTLNGPDDFMAALSVASQQSPKAVAEHTASHADRGARRVTTINKGEWESEWGMSGWLGSLESTDGDIHAAHLIVRPLPLNQDRTLVPPLHDATPARFIGV